MFRPKCPVPGMLCAGVARAALFCYRLETWIARTSRLRQQSDKKGPSRHAHEAILLNPVSPMPSVRFTGRVFPAVLSVSIPNRPTFNWQADDLGLDMTFRVRIQDGSITIDCDVNKFDEDAHLVPLFMRASDIAKAAIDLAAFATGSGLKPV